MPRHAPADAVIISLQNGVGNVPVLRQRLPGRRVLAGMVAFNVVSRGEGRFHRATSGDIVLEQDEAGTANALSVPGLKVRPTPDIAGVQWGKLLVNLNNALNALSDLPLRQQLAQRGWRRLFADQMAEGLRVVKAEGIRPVSSTPVPAGLTPHLLRLPDAVFATLLRGAMKVDPEARSSMWEDLQRGRRTEIDYLQGVIIAIAEQARPAGAAVPARAGAGQGGRGRGQRRTPADAGADSVAVRAIKAGVSPELGTTAHQDNMRFIQTFQLYDFLDTLVSLLTAFVFGTLIGAERQYRQRSAGLRTNVLVAVGASAFVDLGNRLTGAEGSVRVIAYVVSGIGFLGAGAIMKEGMNVRGLNTAATLWASAAVGCCAGADMVAQAALLTMFVLGGNTLLRPLVNAIDRIPIDEHASEASYDVLVSVDAGAVASVREVLLEKLEAANYPVRDTKVVYRPGDIAEIVATLVSQSIEPDELDAVVAGLAGQPGVRHATWNIRALE